MESTPTICTKQLSLSYDSSTLLQGVDLCAFAGEIIGITGVSGCGKSSLFHCLCGVIPTLIDGEVGGEIFIDGKSLTGMSLPEISTHVGIVFQNPETQLFLPTVEDEVAFGPENLCLPQDELIRRIDRALAVTGMSDHRMEAPARLSGGQKQLVVLAAVLSMEPSILLLDEVLAQVDTQGRSRILPTIVQLAAQGKTILMIDHDPDNLKICTRMLRLEKGQLYHQ